MKILFLSGWFPLPIDNGSKIRIFNLLRGLCAQHEVTLLSFYRREDELDYLSQMREMCAKVEVVPWREFNPASLQAKMGYFSPKPRSLLDTFSLEMQSLIFDELSVENNYQLGIISQSNMLAYLDCFKQVPILFEELELGTFYDHYRDAKSLSGRMRSGLTWWKTSRFIARSLEKVSACTVVSQDEREILNEIAPAYKQVEIVPNCVDFNHYSEFINLPKQQRLVHTGSLTYQANYEAVLNFLDQIWPRIIDARPATEFWITGRSEGFPLPKAAADPQVHLTGYVDDVRPVIAGSAVSVVPLLSGGGTRLKILESLALNTAVVSTSKGVQGLDLRQDEHLLIADSPRDFAAAVLRLLKDEGLRQQLARQGRERVYYQYNWDTVLPKFMNIVDQFDH